MPHKYNEETETMEWIFECDKCGDNLTFGEPDPCMGGYMPGVAHACCGHGDNSVAYVCGWPGCSPNYPCTNFTTGEYQEGYWVVRGELAISYIERNKVKPDD